MIRRGMDVTAPPSKIVFSPASVAFNAFEIDVPILTTDGPSLANFTERVDAEICNSCSRESCLGHAALRTHVFNPTDRASFIVVDGADLFCNSDGCPLEGPPDSKDRAPISHAPILPAIRVELDVLA